VSLTLTGRNVFGDPVAVTASGSLIESVRPASDAAAGDLWILPGFVDLQVNGYAGHDFNARRPSGDAAAAVTRALWPRGVTRFCPTICTASREQMIADLRAVDQACRENAAVNHAVAGIHVEGPYIAPEDGPRGAHPKDHVRDPDWAEVEAFQEAAGGRIRLFTLAPERPGAVDLIERLSRAGIVPAIGHTNAGPGDIRAAVDAGARLSTHLGNGAHAVLPRHPNYIWDQLAADGLSASLIVDGHHLPPAVVKTFVRAKGPQRCVLVSDAVWVAGQPPGTYQFLSGPVELTASGAVRVAGTPYLAGSALDLAAAVGNVIRFAGIGLADAVQMASRAPASLLGRLDLGLLVPGAAADLILARWTPESGRLEVVQTVAGGEVVYTR